MSYFHIPVLLKEVIENIDPKPGENLVDGTIGGGGHSKAILERTSPDGKLLGIDFDQEALIECKRRLSEYSGRVFLERGNYVDFGEFTKKNNFDPINIFFLDLGISSHQLDDENLGISFLGNAPLDMRLGGFDQNNDERTTAENIVNNCKEEEIEEMLKKYGEERYAKLIAREIVSKRKEHRIVNTSQLVGIIEKAVPSRYKKQKIHYATRTFQALRIAVNKELENLSEALPRMLEKVSPGGRIAVISFHSLEDRIVKQFFRRESKDCICEPEIPVCVCGHRKKLEIITKKAITAGDEEIAQNPRSRSAKLRVARKI
ncbi:MAG: 16S rRNA (cytosine(1402)-N(4))-methyltransferase RsmH [Candidatus Paceibacterota bacterium]|jgi:16S rRNA (cytosine1402-N4)-methyltransferase